jgi:hypothetical protein
MMSAAERAMPVSRLSDLLAYDAETGRITWRVRKGSRAPIGSEAGCVDANRRVSYRTILIDYKKHAGHRVAWALAYGVWPDGEIDHINGDGLDNRLCNLRVSDRQQNRCNSRVPVTNTSGYKGVSWCKSKKQWHAGIKRNYQTINLGYFDDVTEAAEAYRHAATKYHGDFARVE